MPRIIIFQKKYQKELPEEDSSSKDSLQSDNQVCINVPIEDFPSTFKERKFLQNCNRLKNMIEAIKNDEKSSNMIGVFGLYSDKVIKEVLKDVSDVIYYNKIYYDGTIDLYDCILCQLQAQYKNSTDYHAKFGDFGYDLFTISAHHKITNDVKNWNRLNFIYENLRRDKNIINLPERLWYFYKKKFILDIEANNIDYDILRMLDNLNSPHFIIILSCALDTSTIRKNIEEKSLLIGVDTLEKYFSDDNFIVAD